MLKGLKNLKSTVQNVYHKLQQLLFELQTPTAEIHLYFQGYVRVSCGCLYITMDECR
jgi:hypothetical protein